MNTPSRIIARGPRRLRVGAWAMVALCAMPGTGAAEGPGVRSSRLIFHPRLEVGGAYDSNFFRDAEAEFTAPVDPVWVLLAEGGLKLANRAPTRLGVSLELAASYRELFDADELDAAEHGDRQLEARSGLDGVDGQLQFALMPRSSFSLVLAADGRYTDEPAADLLYDEGFQRLEISAGPDLLFRPGDDADSRALELRLGYRFALLRYLDLAPALGTARAQKDTHKIRLNTRWNFYPKTAALLDVQLWVINYPEVTDALGQSGTRASPDKDLTPLRVSGGLRGLLTRRLSATARIGFAHSFNAAGQSYQGVIGQAELEYVLEPTLRLRLSYVRRVDDDGFANFFTMDRAAIEARLQLPARVHLEGRFGVDAVDYSEDGVPDHVQMDRTELMVLGGLEVGWHLTDWLSVAGTWKIEDNRTDFCYRLDLAPAPCPANPTAEEARQLDRAAYTRQVTSLRLRLAY